MQQRSSVTPPSKSENRYPDSLYLELTATPVSSEGTDIKEIDLYLSLDCGQQWHSINTGRVQLGFKGGELSIRADNGKILPQSLQASPEEPSPLQPIECRMVTENETQYPVWVWQGKTNTSVFQGSLKHFKLGTVQVTGQPCTIEAVFTVSPSHLYLTRAEGLWVHTISPNQLAVLERKLILCLVESRLQPYLSRVVWQYDPEQGLQPQTGDRKITPNMPQTSEIPQLANVIQQVLSAGTDNFLELAKIAALNPLVDFAGAKLLGVNLSGLDLSGANLHHAYLRGADLSDTDFSSADLQNANLGGADLSGAYLSDANLTKAVLHRVSLALANLSGANLTGANLSEANLSNTNFSDTNLTNANLCGCDLHQASLTFANLSGTTWQNSRVAEARFSKNLGLSEECKLDLKQRGAIFGEEVTSEG
jgi:uncharacterized protein YjbI with pentapeptide repeats